MRSRTLKALAAWQRQQRGAFSAADLAGRLECSHAHATNVIRREVEAGRMRYAGRQARPNVTGGLQKVPVYERVMDGE